MELTTKQIDKLKRFATITDSLEAGIVSEFSDLNDKIDANNEEMMKCMTDMASKEMPEPIDHTDQLQAILDKLNEPEVEDTIEVSLNII